jgi:hypothetical protein
MDGFLRSVVAGMTALSGVRCEAPFENDTGGSCCYVVRTAVSRRRRTHIGRTKMERIYPRALLECIQEDRLPMQHEVDAVARRMSREIFRDGDGAHLAPTMAFVAMAGSCRVDSRASGVPVEA